MRRHPFSLIEVGIAIALAALVIGLLFSSYVQNAKLKNKVSTYSHEMLKQKHVHETLTQLFAAIDLKQPLKYEEDILTFTYDHHIDPDPAFCGLVKAKLALDDHNLILTITSSKTPDSHRSRTLMSDIKSLSWSFISEDQNLTDTWADKKHPIAIRLTLNGNLSFAFFPSIIDLEIR